LRQSARFSANKKKPGQQNKLCAPEAEAILEPVAQKAHTNAMYADNERRAEKGIFEE
jgi:hypothetical protein